MDTTLNEATTNVTKEVSKISQYFTDKLPLLLDFGLKIVLAFVFFFVGTKVIKWVRTIVRKSISRSGADKGVEQFVDSMLKFVLYTLLLVTIGVKLGIESTSVAALLASGGVAIGLALQGSLSNFAGGVLILLLKPFVVGDYIIEDSNKNEGTVKEIQIFYTKLATIDNKTIVIPNGSLANNSLTNVTAKDQRRLDLKVGVGYHTDLKLAKKLLNDILRTDEEILQEEEILVFVDELGESSIVLGMRAWVSTDTFWSTKWRLLEEIKLTFDQHKIDIPYRQITVHMGEQKDIAEESVKK